MDKMMENVLKGMDGIMAGAQNSTGLPDPTKLAQMLNLEGDGAGKDLPFDEKSLQEME